MDVDKATTQGGVRRRRRARRGLEGCVLVAVGAPRDRAGSRVVIGVPRRRNGEPLTRDQFAAALDHSAVYFVDREAELVVLQAHWQRVAGFQ
jgi:hypothetical protein